MSYIFNEDRVRNALDIAWSDKTAIQWSRENPANGQCNVTAAVIHDLFGGDILRTRYPNFWHYYNRIGGEAYDLTDSQFYRPGALFEAPTQYDDELTDQQSALDGIPQREFDTLKSALMAQLEKIFCPPISLVDGARGSVCRVDFSEC